jgi:hypothetical protein
VATPPTVVQAPPVVAVPHPPATVRPKPSTATGASSGVAAGDRALGIDVAAVAGVAEPTSERAIAPTLRATMPRRAIGK